METNWIHDEILDGLSQLLCLSLDRTPAADMIAGTAMGWHRAVTDDRVWDQQLDTPRFRKAFTNLIKNCRQWPSPAAFMEAMPPREQLALTKQPITSAPDSPEMRARFEELSKVLGMPAPKKCETGHGHVRKRTDGVRVRCGGPGICNECSRERALMVGH